MGRPKLVEGERRSVNMIVRLTDAEKKQLKKVAATCGLAPGVMARLKLFIGKSPKARMLRIELDAFEGTADFDCKFEVFLEGNFLLSLVPQNDFLQVSNDPGLLDEETIHQLINKIEAHYL